MRAYSLGIIIVAKTVGSQEAVTRCLGLDGNAAGFWTSTLLKNTKYGLVKDGKWQNYKAELQHIPPIRILKYIRNSGNCWNDMCTIFLY